MTEEKYYNYTCTGCGMELEKDSPVYEDNDGDWFCSEACLAFSNISESFSTLEEALQANE
ncbi:MULTISPECIES: hypothetical protein [Lactobacillus]|uniref:Uncharacterized protein n=2 Tax=Lactobacillus TaxID=1578 RepID=A0AAW5WZX1_9LACO|nr:MULTISPECIES: hypothetical protein [Lactobacillus]MCT7750467.1 hypothetical protein [Lactobacillus gasseri]DAS59737.1 MAG TPA: protein of unknown function (DUF3330) [Caudoviricetes sp.]EEX26689.1 hypothetical protein HMPREF0527_01528 [Lactobacillus jensenii SJ-7A-US]KAA9322972.1 hypothetical protein F6H94_04250 [Lactobacillus jensenii]KAA9369475.1 hypothetical protein F6I25_02035 [Lactobacillus jensenii]